MPNLNKRANNAVIPMLPIHLPFSAGELYSLSNQDVTVVSDDGMRRQTYRVVATSGANQYVSANRLKANETDLALFAGLAVLSAGISLPWGLTT
jgi:hypothetical protein